MSDRPETPAAALPEPGELTVLEGLPTRSPKRDGSSTVARIETGHVQPTLPMLQTILIAAGWEMRIRRETYDGHDDVLDTLAAVDPARARSAKAGTDALAARLSSAS